MYIPLTVQPDIILGMETWLDSNIASYKYFPTSQYNIDRYDRSPSKTVKQLKLQDSTNCHYKINHKNRCKRTKTDCEVLLALINISGSKKLLVCSYYRPPQIMVHH